MDKMFGNGRLPTKKFKEDDDDIEFNQRSTTSKIKVVKPKVAK